MDLCDNESAGTRVATPMSTAKQAGASWRVGNVFIPRSLPHSVATDYIMDALQTIIAISGVIAAVPASIYYSICCY